LLFPVLAACASSFTPIPQAWKSVPEAARITDLCAKVECAPRAANDVKVIDGQLITASKALTPRFAAIQSFDVSLDRQEIVFSAKRNNNFDVGLVSLDGGEIHWIPEDPADETDVQWAPKGNKVSYVVHTQAGDLVRTVHVPTAMQLTVDFPYARVQALGWDPAAERYAVVLNSPEASERIESVSYRGERRRIEVPPEVGLKAVVEPVGGALLLRPEGLRYGERLPLVVWIEDQPLAWDDARGMLMRSARVASAVESGPPDWKALMAIPWVDTERIYVVGVRAGEDAGAPPKTIYITPTDDESGYRRRGNEVLVPRAGVKSFAASWIAQQLKERNGVR
jgi:hypothetical protein